MLTTLAVAALAIGAPAKKQVDYLLPLYDLVTSVSNTGVLTINFSMSCNWNPSVHSFMNFKVFYVNGDMSHFSPNGNWIDITAFTDMEAYNNVAIFTYDFTNNTPSGTVWIQYAGSSSDSPNGAETSFGAVQFPAPTQQGHGGLPGHVVPIVHRTPGNQNYSLPIAFTIESPWTGSWDGNGPSFWMNTGNNNSPLPGNGWQSLNTTNLATTNGAQTITVSGNPNSNSGYYCIGVAETYTPSESYNTHSLQWTQFSGVVRSFSIPR